MVVRRIGRHAENFTVVHGHQTGPPTRRCLADRARHGGGHAGHQSANLKGPMAEALRSLTPDYVLGE